MDASCHLLLKMVSGRGPLSLRILSSKKGVNQEFLEEGNSPIAKIKSPSLFVAVTMFFGVKLSLVVKINTGFAEEEWTNGSLELVLVDSFIFLAALDFVA